MGYLIGTYTQKNNSKRIIHLFIFEVNNNLRTNFEEHIIKARTHFYVHDCYDSTHIQKVNRYLSSRNASVKKIRNKVCQHVPDVSNDNS